MNAEQVKWTVLISDFNYADNEIEREALSKWRADVFAAQCATPQEVMEASRNADAIISQYAPITAEVISSLTRCKVLARYGIGVDTIDVAAATKHEIAVINVPSYCEDEVSDHALGLLMAWARRIPHYTDEIRKGAWNWKTGRPIHRLRGQTLGLLGFGKIARVLAHKAIALGAEVIAHDPYVSDAFFEEEGIPSVGLDEVLSRSDYLSIHVPLTSETRHLINADSLSQMKPTACLINTSRGAVVDEAALARAIQDGELAGACLDVVEDEVPAANNPLLRLPQVLLTPHVAWYSEESQIELRRKVSEDVGRALNGILPHGLVNKELEKRFTQSSG
jgi:D-3-phosphoglycerate dehydrogenase